MRSVSSAFYDTAAWKKCRDAYLHSVNGLCEECQKNGLLRSADIVHHKTHLTDDNVNDPEISLGWDNLEAVCIDCHNKIHYGKKTDRRYTIVDGNVIFVGNDGEMMP